MDIAVMKQELRLQMVRVRAGISEESRREQSLSGSLLADQEVLAPLREQRGGRLTVCSYASFGDEPDTRYLMRGCLEHGDRLLVPRIGPERTLTLHEISGEEELAPGTWGIPEPGHNRRIWPSSRYPEIDVMIVPGLAFDRKGGRVGFGAGYYDRLVSGMRERSESPGKTIVAALALKELIVTGGDIPLEEHDFKLDMLFTATGIIYMRK